MTIKRTETARERLARMLRDNPMAVEVKSSGTGHLIPGV
jgi:hypothetical protein